MENTLYKYSKMIRSTDERVMDVFKDIQVISEDGKSSPVPIVWANLRNLKAFAYHVKNADGSFSEKLRLPVLGITSIRLNPYSDFEMDEECKERPKDWPHPISISYQVNLLGLLREDCNQIIEQVLSKLYRPIYLDQKDGFETKLTLNNVDFQAKDDSNITYASTEPREVYLNRFVLYAEYNSRQKTEAKKPERYKGDGEARF